MGCKKILNKIKIFKRVGLGAIIQIIGSDNSVIYEITDLLLYDHTKELGKLLDETHRHAKNIIMKSEAALDDILRQLTVLDKDS